MHARPSSERGRGRSITTLCFWEIGVKLVRGTGWRVKSHSGKSCQYKGYTFVQSQLEKGIYIYSNWQIDTEMPCPHRAFFEQQHSEVVQSSC